MSEIIQYELDMGEPDEPEQPKPRRSARVSRQGLGLAVAFALGVLIGAAGLDKHYDSSAARSRNGEVSLIAVLAGISQTNAEPLAYEVRIYNDGPLPVHLDGAALLVPGYGTAGIRTPHASHSQTVAPGKWAMLMPSIGEPACEVQPAVDDSKLAIMVTTADEHSRSVEIPLLDQHRELESERNSECEALRHPERTVYAYAEQSVLDGDDTTTVTLQIDSWGRRPVDIVSVEPRDDLDVRLHDRLPVTVEPHSTATIVMEIVALDCAVFDGGGPHLTMTTRYEEATMGHEVWLDPYTAGIALPDERDG